MDLRKVAIAILLLFVVAACGGDDGGSSGPGSPGGSAQGTFLDAVVAGLGYTSGTTSSVTDSLGRFTFVRGSGVTFRIGDIAFGQGSAKFIMTPVDLVPGALDESHAHVVNRARFLLTLDDDGVTTNGIRITQAVRGSALGRSVNFDQTMNDFEADTGAQQVVSVLTAQTSAGQRPLVSVVQAQVHLQLTLLGIITGLYGGDYYADVSAAGQGRELTQGQRLGEWFFAIDANANLSGALRPIGGGQIDLTGVANSSGAFEAAGAGGLFFAGRITIDPAQDILRIEDGIWFQTSQGSGTFTGEKQD